MKRACIKVGWGLGKWRTLLGAAAFMGVLSAAASPAHAFNSYPGPAEVGGSFTGRAIATHNNLIAAGAPSWGHHTVGNNWGDDQMGAVFVYQRGNHLPIRRYEGTAPAGYFGSDTAMSSLGLVASSTQPPRVHFIPYAGGSLANGVAQAIAPPAPFYGKASVDLSGQHLVVGITGLASDQGRVFVYTFNTRTRRFNDSPRELTLPWGADSSFGSAVAIDATRIIVGAPTAGGAGAAYIFEMNAAGEWREVFASTPRFSMFGGTYGSSVDIAGNVAGVCDPTAGTVGGYAHFLGRTSAGWQSVDYALGGEPTDVAVSNDKFVIGYGEANQVLTYRYAGSKWQPLGKFITTRPLGVGYSLAMQGDFLAFGAPTDSTGSYEYTGAAYSADIWESSGSYSF